MSTNPSPIPSIASPLPTPIHTHTHSPLVIATAGAGLLAQGGARYASGKPFLSEALTKGQVGKLNI